MQFIIVSFFHFNLSDDFKVNLWKKRLKRATSYLHEDVMRLAKNFVCVCGGSYKQSQCSNPDSAEYMNKKDKMFSWTTNNRKDKQPS